MDLAPQISYDDFAKVDIRSGTIIKVEEFPKAKKPAYKVWADFGPIIGVKQTSAQITYHYWPETLIGEQILGAVNIGTRNIAGFMSEFLLLGFEDEQNQIVLATPGKNIPTGRRLI